MLTSPWERPQAVRYGGTGTQLKVTTRGVDLEDLRPDKSIKELGSRRTEDKDKVSGCCKCFCLVQGENKNGPLGEKKGQACVFHGSQRRRGLQE